LEGPPWSRDRLFLRAAFLFFPLFRSGAVGTRWCVLTSFPYAGADAACCTTHVSRLCRHRDGECRDTRWSFSAASNPLGALVPAYAKAWLNVSIRPCVPGSGEGPHPSPAGDVRRRHKSRSGRPINGEGRRAKVPLGSSAFTDAAHSAWQSTNAGYARDGPVRRSAHPLRSLTR
jgi:hypothetical protein